MKTFYTFILYIAGNEPNSVKARRNLETLCSEVLDGRCSITIIDVFEDFEAALRERVVVTPTLIVRTENPETRMLFFGSLEDLNALMEKLSLKEAVL